MPEGVCHSPKSDFSSLLNYLLNTHVVCAKERGVISAVRVNLGNLYGRSSVLLLAFTSVPCLCAQATAQAAKSARTVVITGVPDGLLHNDVMTDILMIHFQMSKNNGGDVEEVMYPTRRKGVAYVTFEDQEGI